MNFSAKRNEKSLQYLFFKCLSKQKNDYHIWNNAVSLLCDLKFDCFQFFFIPLAQLYAVHLPCWSILMLLLHHWIQMKFLHLQPYRHPNNESGYKLWKYIKNELQHKKPIKWVAPLQIEKEQFLKKWSWRMSSWSLLFTMEIQCVLCFAYH